MWEPMLWRTRATSGLELLQRTQQRPELLVGSAGAPATSVSRAAALFSSNPTCKCWHCQNCTRFCLCDKRPRASRRAAPTLLQAAALPRWSGEHRVGTSNGSFTRGHGGTGQRARGAWGCANMGMEGDRHPDWEPAPGGRAILPEDTRYGGETAFLSAMEDEAIS